MLGITGSRHGARKVTLQAALRLMPRQREISMHNGTNPDKAIKHLDGLTWPLTQPLSFLQIFSLSACFISWHLERLALCLIPTVARQVPDVLRKTPDIASNVKIISVWGTTAMKWKKTREQKKTGPVFLCRLWGEHCGKHSEAAALMLLKTLQSH